MNTGNNAHLTGSIPAPDSSDTSSPTVLCVDDDPNISEAIARRFRRHGIRVLRAFLEIQGIFVAVMIAVVGPPG